MSEASGLFRTKVLTTGRYNLGSPNTKSQVSDNAALLCPYSPKNFVQLNIRLTETGLVGGTPGPDSFLLGPGATWFRASALTVSF